MGVVICGTVPGLARACMFRTPFISLLCPPSLHAPPCFVCADYITGVTKLSQFADYLVINISSPNTPGALSYSSATRSAAFELCASIYWERLVIHTCSPNTPGVLLLFLRCLWPQPSRMASLHVQLSCAAVRACLLACFLCSLQGWLLCSVAELRAECAMLPFVAQACARCRAARSWRRL